MKILRTFMAIGLFLLIALDGHSQVFSTCVEATITAVGDPELELCQGDGLEDRIRFRSSPLATPFAYIVVDENDIIVHAGLSSRVDFENLPNGTLRVFSVSYIGQFLGEVGDNYLETQLGSFCFHLSGNFITISNLTPEGGAVSTAAGETAITLCLSDDVANVVNFTTSSDFQPYLFVITDNDNNILGTSEDGTVDFSSADIGVCRVWGLAYVGDYLGQAGDNLLSINLASGCSELSSNFVTVTRLFPEAGSLSYSDGSDTFISCSVLEPSGLVELVSTNDPATDFVFLIVNNETNTVTSVNTASNIDLAVIPTGSYSIYGLSYTGNLTVAPGDLFNPDQLSDECADLSDNSLTFIKRVQNADDIMLEDGSSEITICVNDGIADQLVFTSTYAGNDNFTHIITDESNFVLGISDDSTIDFETAGIGICRVWGLAYSGNLTVEIGQNIGAPAQLSDECFDLSDGFVLINRNGPAGGTISYEDGSDSFISCTTTEPEGIISMNAQDNDPNSDYAFVVVNNEDNTITLISNDGNVDLATLPSGTYTVYGVSYLDGLAISVGDQFDADAVGSGCFDLSDNTMVLVKRVQNADDIMFSDGSTEMTICVGDGAPDVLTVTSTYSGDDNFIYIITNEGNFVLGTSEDGIIDFEGAGAGICRVWGLVYSGNLTVEDGDNIGPGQDLADECFDLTDGFVVVNRYAPNGGTISLEDGSTAYEECMAGTGGTVLSLVAQDAEPNLAYTYIVVNTETGLIVDISSTGQIDLDQLGLGTYEAFGLSYFENLTVAVGDVFSGAAFSDVCFDLSDNGIDITNRFVSVNEITFEGGGTVAAICPDDGIIDILSFETDYTGSDDLAFLVTDVDNTIIEILASASTDFEGYTGDFVRVWAAAFSGNFLLQSGITIDPSTLISDDCYDLSENFLLVDLRGPNGGEVSFSDGSSTMSVCVSDGIADVLSLQNSAPAGTNYLYIITDEDNTILDASDSSELDFENAPAGVCRIWGLAYLGAPLDVLGQNLDTASLSTRCFDLSDNFVEVVRTFIDGGTVSLEDGTTSTFACSMDGEDDFFIFNNTSTATEEYGYLVTDNENNILAILEGNSVNFDLAAPGVCRVWGLSYTGEIIAETGENAATTTLTDACFELSGNFITIQRDEVIGGMVSLEDGNTIINICPDDGIEDFLTFINNGSTTASYTYLLTDVNNNILSNVGTSGLDFDNILVPAEVRVWGVAYSGLLNLSGGDIETSELSNRCYDVSGNFVTVIREQPVGGTVSTTDGETTLYLCTDDGISDIYGFAASGASNTAYAYIITDENNTVLDLLTNANETDFEGAPNGTCRVWGVAYTGTLLVQMGDNLLDVMLSDDCADLSADYVTVVRGQLHAGTVSSTLGAGDRFTCPGDGIADELSFVNQGTGSGTFTFVLTDDNNLIVAVPGGSTIDFELLPEGEYRLHGLVYTGDLLAEAGMDAGESSLATACFDLSDNYITIFNIAPAAGLLSTEEGTEEVVICIGDGVPDPFTLTAFGASEAAYTYLIVDTDSILVGTLDGPTFDFENAAPGDWRIYGLSYTGSISILPGGHIFEDQLASGCSDVSGNFIFVDKTYVDGGNVFTDEGATIVYACPDGEADIVNFINSSTSTEANYDYVLTTQGNIVLQVLAGNTIDLEQAVGLDALRLWGVSYTGTLGLSVGNIITDVAISDGCNTLSGNFVDIFIGQPEGGTLSFDNGTDSLNLCHSNFMPGPHVNTTSTANVGYAYILTDTANIVIEVSEPTDGIVNLDNVPAGTYRIWAVSYTGNLFVEVGNEVDSTVLASSCFEISDNFLTVERTESLDAGNVGTMSGEETVYICPQDGIPDIVILTNDTDDDAYRYIITDNENRIIFGDVESNLIDFDPSLPGICRVYGVVYTGEFDPTFMADITTSPISTDCWALSNNYITLVRQQPDGGVVSTSDGSIDVEFITNDGEADIVTMVNTGIQLTPYQYFITGEDNVILGTSADGVINFEGVPAGVCRIWGVSYTGNITATVGDHVGEVALSDDCYDLSGNFVTVTRITEDNFVPNFGPVAIPTEEQIILRAFPNPAVDQLTLQVEVPEALLTTSQTVSCYDINGNVMFQRALSPVAGTDQSTINISQLQSGLYLLRWFDGQQVKVLRFVKE